MQISSQVFDYVFNASGDYEIEIVDSFDRMLTYEHSFRRSFVMNTSSIGLIAGAIAIGVVLLLGTVIGARSYMFKFK